jgi:thioredoxin reductase (NADPH)
MENHRPFVFAATGFMPCAQCKARSGTETGIARGSATPCINRAMHSLDCLVIGAGPAGLTAAIYLARYRRDFLVLDGGASRAELIPRTHNFPAWPQGVSGEKLLSRLREQALAHEARFEAARVEVLQRDGECFVALAGETRWRARNVILATGVVDRHPDWPGMREATLAGLLRWCPICDGFELLDKDIALVTAAGSGLGHAKFLRTYSKTVTLVALSDEEGLDPAGVAELEAAGIELEARPLSGFEARGERVALKFADGSAREFDAVYPMLGCQVQGQLAVQLGARCNEAGDLLVDAHQCTSVEGLYAIGDVVSDINQISVGTGHAAIAATAIHNRLARNFRSG